MDFLFNDMSHAGQFPNVDAFRESVGRLMEIRQEIQRMGSSLYCHRKLAHARVTANVLMQQAVQAFPIAERRAWMQWLTTHGPYWEDARLHSESDWLEVNGTIVTDTAIGEAATCRLRGLWRELVSFVPSDWLFTPVNVTSVRNDLHRDEVAIPNHWQLPSVQACLAANPPQIVSWEALANFLETACTRLTFSEDAFEPLAGHPFYPGAADRIRVLLHTLDTFKGCFDVEGKRTEEGHRLFTDHFTGDKAWFSDSSETEKNDFRRELTFSHPERPEESLFCTWHGKVKTPQLRIHFSWPVRNEVPLYVVYVGPKITKR